MPLNATSNRNGRSRGPPPDSRSLPASPETPNPRGRPSAAPPPENLDATGEFGVWHDDGRRGATGILRMACGRRSSRRRRRRAHRRGGRVIGFACTARTRCHCDRGNTVSPVCARHHDNDMSILWPPPTRFQRAAAGPALAIEASSSRELAPTRWQARYTWPSTLRTDITSRSAISRLVRPASRVRRSRAGVRSGAGWREPSTPVCTTHRTRR